MFQMRPKEVDSCVKHREFDQLLFIHHHYEIYNIKKS